MGGAKLPTGSKQKKALTPISIKKARKRAEIGSKKFNRHFDEKKNFFF